MQTAQFIINKLVSNRFEIVPPEEIHERDPSDKIQYFLNDNEKLYAVRRGRRKDDLHYFSTQIVRENCPLKTALDYLEEYEYLLVRDENKVFTGYLSRDILIQQLAYQLESTNAYLNTILETINESCTVIDENQSVIYWTKGAEDIFSFSKEEIIGKPITEFFNVNNLKILQTLEHGKSVYQHQHKAREDLVVMINSNPVKINDKIIGAVVSEMNVTKMHRLNEELLQTSEKLVNLEKQMQANGLGHDPFILIRGSSPEIKNVLSNVRKVAETQANILIYGESGVGKELFARAVHAIREQSDAPFVAINCGAIPNGLFESEIFGYEKGAFSGASQKGKKGKVELARGGTLFLDEIGEMPLDMQVKLLRLLQEKTYYPVGGTKEIEVEFNLVAATNRDLIELVKEKRFREDLYYRLNVVNLTVPPLRERGQDILELSNYFLYEKSIKYNRPIQGIPTEIADILLQYSWPGNVRELSNVIERLVIFSNDGVINKKDLPPEIFTLIPEKNSKPSASSEGLSTSHLNEQLEQVERDILLEQLKLANGNKQVCAKNLGVTRSTLYNRLKKLNIDV
ncbi:sigma-54-dependent Fis family transcriptional regulator [Solibacillus silvestris]|nr:sigma 54-interacting transcriptional regulator [Solibacillus silvestris]OBW58851.1 sigma-54-dependent Fis family transcriptional regulator [Solibacillus silvestris]